jgi:hypothetical protein
MSNGDSRALVAAAAPASTRADTYAARPESPWWSRTPLRVLVGCVGLVVRLRGRGSVVLLAGLVVLVLGVLAVPAFAAPEAPEALAPTEVKAATADLAGVLSPHAPGEAGSFYKFLYKASKTNECEGGVETAAAIAVGGEHEELPAEPVSGLAAGTEYAVCVVAENAAQTERTRSAAVSFVTAIPPEVPVTLSPAKSITGVSAKLEGTLNPVKAGEAGTYEFTYERSATECAREFGAPEPAGAMTGAAKQAVSVTVAGLEPLREYTFCLVAINAAGESAAGSPVHLKTLAAPPAIEAQSVSNVKAGEAVLEGVVNPDNQLSECHFQYGTLAVSENEVACSPELLSGFGGQAVNATISALSAGTVYHYRILAKNGTGELEAGKEEQFTTALPPEAPRAEPASVITATTAMLNGVLNPEHAGEAGSYEFLYKASESECEGAGATPAAAAAGSTPEVLAPTEVTGLSPGTEYTVCLLARNSAGETALSPPVTFTTPAIAPEIESESVSGVTADSATLEGQINPGGAQTTYHFEYDTTPYTTNTPHGTSIPTPDQNAGNTPTSVPVTTPIQGLTPETAYHYRLITTNTIETRYGTDHTFTTQPTGGPLQLPDHRAWEMTSPPNKNASIITGISGDGGVIQAEEAGNSIAYTSNGAFEKPTSAPFGGQYLSTRGPEGWSTANINAPMLAQTYGVVGRGGPYKAFSANLSQGLLLNGEFLPVQNPPLTPDAPAGYQNYYLHETRAGSTEGFQAVLTEALLNGAPSVEPSSEFKFDFQGATPQLDHVVFAAQAALTDDAVDDGEPNLYEWSGGQLHLVNVLPGQTQSTPGATLGGNNSGPSGLHPISDDGSVVFFTEQLSSGTALFARKNAEQPQSALGLGGECTEAEKACTIEVDASQEGLESGFGEFRAASSDGSRVFFTDELRLTGDSTNARSSGHHDLYEYNLTSGRLRDLTTADLAGAEVQGVLGASEDGSYVYFVANGVLAPGASRGECKSEEGGGPQTCNLYVWHDGTTRFIATLSEDDNEEASKGPGHVKENAYVADDWAVGLQERTARVTPDGLGLVFMSDGRLTGYDNRNPEAGGREQEVYVYNASSAVLSCASCRPTGSRPTGPSSIPGGTAYTTSRAIYQSRVISDVNQTGGVRGARVFFDSVGAIVPQATNGVQDVYEWEEDGAGTCGQAGGCVSLISSGTSSSESSFADASADGSDVFFLSYAELVPQDTDDLVDVYDARESGGFPGPGSSLACSGTGCQGVPGAPPPYATPSSVTFGGVGNFPSPPPSRLAAPPKPLTAAQKLARALKVCAKKPKRGRAACRERAKRRFGPKSKIRASSQKGGK